MGVVYTAKRPNSRMGLSRVITGAAYPNRTGDHQITKLELYQLS